MTISTRGTRLVLAILGAALLCALAVGAYFRFRGPVGGLSPYDKVDGLTYALCGQDKIAYALEQETYPADAETLTVTLRNGAPDGAVVPGDPRHADWAMEVWSGGAWHTLRTRRKAPSGPGCRRTAVPAADHQASWPGAAGNRPISAKFPIITRRPWPPGGTGWCSRT